MTPELRDQALAWAMKEMPRESCGVVIVEKGRSVFVPCRNVSEYSDAFAIHPEDYAAAEDRGEIVRIVHSHVYQSGMPSQVDLVSCEATGLPWSIVSVPNGLWFDFNPSGYKAPLVGRQWGHAVSDCYTLIKDYFRERLSIELPDFEREPEWWLKGGNLYLENFEKAGFREVPFEDLKTHDVILMQIMSPVVNHGGVYLGDDLFLHHLHRRLSCREIFSGYYLKHTVKVVRHENCQVIR